jgi:uncharacterized protein (TIGR02246 family)
MLHTESCLNCDNILSICAVRQLLAAETGLAQRWQRELEAKWSFSLVCRTKYPAYRSNRKPDRHMRIHSHRQIALALFLALSLSAFAQPTTPNASNNPDGLAIRDVLNAQVASWNRGDVAAFMQGYKNSPSTTFVGKTIRHGYAAILARYRETYAGQEKMGQLGFDGLEVNQLDAHYATVTGRYHLARTASAGGNAEGIFSLVFEKTKSGWKIILDHTS